MNASEASPTRRVLYVDDDEGLALLVARNLTRAGYSVETASSGEAALSRLREGAFDIVGCDHVMPGMIGLDVLKAIRALPDPPPVVYVTGNEESRVAIAALKAGAADYVIKDGSGEFFDLLRSAFAQALRMDDLRREKERAEAETRAARERAELLLREVNHRVANSLSLVTSFVRLQSTATTNAEAQRVLQDTQSRIWAVAQVHRVLYTSDDVRTVEMKSYLRVLLEELHVSLAGGAKHCRIELDAEEVDVPTDRAISLGIVVTELVTNAVKYAYPGGCLGEVRVSLRRAPDGRLSLAVEDDGVGIQPQHVQGTGLGGKIVKAMAHTLGSSVAYEPREAGTRAVIAFKV